MPHRVVIVRASAAGLTAAEALRRRGYDEHGRLAACSGYESDSAGGACSWRE